MARALAGMVLALLVAVLSAVAAQPAAAQAPAPATGTYLRLAHLSPDTPPVDVVVTSFSGETSVLGAVSYGDVSSYKQIEPGTYTVQMRPAGEPDAVPIVAGTFEAEAGSSYTAAGLGPRSDISVSVLDDDLTPPAPGQARVRVVQGSEQAGDVSIRWNGTETAGGVGFGAATEYVPVMAGPGSFDVVPADGEPTAVPVQLDAGGVYSVFVVQRDGALAGEVRTDALGPDAVPAGGIDTGYGGTAQAGVQMPVAAVAVLLLAVVGLRFAPRAGRR